MKGCDWHLTPEQRAALAAMDERLKELAKLDPREYFRRMVDAGLIWEDGSYRGGLHITEKP